MTTNGQPAPTAAAMRAAEAVSNLFAETLSRGDPLPWDDIASLIDAATGLPELIEALRKVDCPYCKGKGTIHTACSLCGDSTYDHECDDADLPCPKCDGIGRPEFAVAALVRALEGSPVAPAAISLAAEREEEAEHEEWDKANVQDPYDGGRL